MAAKDDTSSVISKSSKPVVIKPKKTSIESKLTKKIKSEDTESVISKSSKATEETHLTIKIKKNDTSNEPTEKVDMTTIYKMLYSMQRDMSLIKADVKILKDKHAKKMMEKSSKCVELRREALSVPKNIAMRCLEYKSIKGEMELFKYCYINDDDKVKVPITCPNQHIFKYWCDNKWNIDVEGEHVKDTLFKNFRKVYITANNVRNYEKRDTSRFIENQKHISAKLTDATYQKNFMKALKALLKEI